MKNCKYILFDLDGTLTDPKVGITGCAAATLREFGIEKDPDSLTPLIGPPLQDSFSGIYGFDDEQCAQAIKIYRKLYADHGWSQNKPYPGIGECLGSLRKSGKKLIVATSKPEELANKVLELFGLDGYFDLICGSSAKEPESARKPAVIRAALSRAGIDDISCAVMVGDRKFDILGAHEVGLRAVGVLYGYGSREELLACDPEYIVSSIKELTDLFTNNDRKAAL